MHVLGHYIDDKKIIGYSPMYSQVTIDKTMLQLYGERQFFFTVYADAQAIEIKTEYLIMMNGSDAEMKYSKEKRAEFDAAYKQVKKHIEQLTT